MPDPYDVATTDGAFRVTRGADGNIQFFRDGAPMPLTRTPELIEALVLEILALRRAATTP